MARHITPTGGWVEVQRGIIDHLVDGRMNLNEFTCFMILVMRADWRTGIVMTCTSSLRVLTRNTLTLKQCERALKNLIDRGYVKSGYTRGGGGEYPVLINKYKVSDGPNKGKRVDAEASSSATNPVYVTARVTTQEFVGGQTSQESPIETGGLEAEKIRRGVQSKNPGSNGVQKGGHSEEKSPIATVGLETLPEVVGGQTRGQTGCIVKAVKNLNKTTPTAVVVETTEVNRTEEQKLALVVTCYQLAGQTPPRKIPAALAAKLSEAVAEYGAEQLSACLTTAAASPYWRDKFKQAHSPVAFLVGSAFTLTQQSKAVAKPVVVRGEYVSPEQREAQVQAVYRDWLPSCTECSGTGEVASMVRPGKMTPCRGCKVKVRELRAQYR
jgi:hypothetical protein